MFLTKKQESAIEFLITVLESRGLEVHYPHLDTNHGKVNISEIRWVATDKNEKISAHIILTNWGKKFKLIVWLPKNPDDGRSAVDNYVFITLSGKQLVLPYLEEHITLPSNIPSDLFMLHQEMRDYLEY